MINRIFSILVISLLGLAQQTMAQGAFDALRYSTFEVSGTARSAGVGGGLGALGADFSVLGTNPAGLGMYRRSEFVLTPGFLITNSESRLLNDSDRRKAEESKSNFNLGALGVVVASKPRVGKWSTFNFGFGFNRIANFNQKLFFEGTSTGSIVDRFQELANGNEGLDDFESGVAFDAFALYDEDPVDGFYETDFELDTSALIKRQQFVDTKGGVTELVISLGGNYDEKFIIGATLGVPFISLTEDKEYQEIDEGGGPDGNVPFFDDLTYTEELTTTGIGINFKLGMIYRINQMFRVGLAAHTPTGFRLEDSFKTSMDYNFTVNEPQSGSAESPDGLFDYKLRTPWRLIGSLGVIIGKSGFVSAEVESVNYGKNSFSFDNFVEQEKEANDGVKANLESALNIRLGGEFSYNIFRFRAGLNLLQSPLVGDDTTNNSISAGVGIREKNFFVDLAYKRFNVQETYVPYLLSDASQQQFVNNDIGTNQFVLTLGFKFR